MYICIYRLISVDESVLDLKTLVIVTVEIFYWETSIGKNACELIFTFLRWCNNE